MPKPSVGPSFMLAIPFYPKFVSLLPLLFVCDDWERLNERKKKNKRGKKKKKNQKLQDISYLREKKGKDKSGGSRVEKETQMLTWFLTHK